jgi:hypothetical protein
MHLDMEVSEYGRAGFVGTGLAETVDGSAKPAPTVDVWDVWGG